MIAPTTYLAKTVEELAAFGKAARDRDAGQIILVPVDFSAHSAAALVHAAKMAKLVPAAIFALHVVHDPGDMPGYYSSLLEDEHFERIQDAAASAFHNFMQQVIAENPDSTVLADIEPVMVIGLPVSRILEVVEVLEPIMVVMGSQGRTGLQHLVLGSKAAQVIQLCPVPITIVKDRKEIVDD